MNKGLKRKYRGTDSDMIEANKLMRLLFLQDLLHFTDFDAELNDAFAADWQAALDAADDSIDDETVLDQLTQKTVVVEKNLIKCRNKFQHCKYFIDKAFPDNAGIQDEFGYDDYEDSRRYQQSMVLFMKKFYAIATKYKVQLIAAGYTQTNIEEILSLAQDLDSSNIDQGLDKRVRTTITQNRVEVYNKVWDIMVRVGKAGKIIFADDFARYQNYLLPSGNESASALSIEGLVKDVVSGVPLAGALINIESLGISTNTDSEGNYTFGGLDAGDYDLFFTLTGYVSQHKTVSVVAGNPVTADVSLQKTA